MGSAGIVLAQEDRETTKNSASQLEQIMDEDTAGKQRHRGRAYATVALVLFPFLFLLAYGPICAIYDDCPPFVQSAFELAYVPLEEAAGFTGTEDSLESLMIPYIEWCSSWRETEEATSDSPGSNVGY